MKQPVRKRFRQTTAAFVALLVVLSVFGPVGTVAAQEVSVTQSAEQTTAAPGETVTLTTTINATDVNGPGLEVELPTGWAGNVTDPDGGHPNAEDGGNVLQILWFEEGTYEATYEFDVPDDAADGDYAVDIEGSGIDPGDGSQITESTQTTVTVEEPPENQHPTASFSVDPASPDVDEEATFDAAGSEDPDGSIAAYEWAFDDGTTDTGETVDHTFDSAGDYDVTLTVTDDDGATDNVTQTVSVSEDPGEEPAETTVSLQPDSDEFSVSSNGTFDLVADDADGGVGAYTATVAVDDPGVATISDVELLGDPGEQTTNVTVAEDGSAVEIDAAMMDTDDTGSVPVATVTVDGQETGTADLSVSVDALGDEEGDSYAVTGTSGASLTVTEISIGDFPPVTDPDGDEMYEDVNGDGEFNIVDIQALFANLDDSALEDNLDKFDFNDDGTVDVVDVQKLYNELVF